MVKCEKYEKVLNNTIVVLDLLKRNERILRLNCFFGMKWNNQCIMHIKNKNYFYVMSTDNDVMFETSG